MKENKQNSEKQLELSKAIEESTQEANHTSQEVESEMSVDKHKEEKLDKVVDSDSLESKEEILKSQEEENSKSDEALPSKIPEDFPTISFDEVSPTNSDLESKEEYSINEDANMQIHHTQSISMIDIESTQESQTHNKKLSQIEDPIIEQLSHLGKQEAAIVMVRTVKEMVAKAQKESQECKLLFESDFRAYQDAKQLLNQGILKQSDRLLAKFGRDLQKTPETIQMPFSEKEELLTPRVKNISSGAFGGVIVSVFAAIVTFLGLLYWSSYKLNMELSIENLPELSHLESLIGWYSKLLMGEESFIIGAGVIGLVIFAVLWIVYAIRISLKASANYSFALKQLQEVQLFDEENGNCRYQMEKVDVYVKALTDLLKLYRLLLAEKNAKLERILYLEGSESFTKLDHNSQEEILEAQALTENIHHLFSIPITEDGKISPRSTLMLQKAKDTTDKIINRYYALNN